MAVKVAAGLKQNPTVTGAKNILGGHGDAGRSLGRRLARLSKARNVEATQMFHW